MSLAIFAIRGKAYVPVKPPNPDVKINIPFEKSISHKKYYFNKTKVI